LGAYDVTTRGRVERVADILQAAGTVEVSQDITSSKWMKLVVNCGELVPSAVMDLPFAEAAAYPGMHDFMVQCSTEAAETALEVGSRLVPIFGLDDVDLSDPRGYADSLLSTVLHRYMLPHSRTTVLQDWMKGRRSEVHEINGLVVQARSRMGRKAPANQVTVEVADRVEAKEIDASPANADMLFGAARRNHST
jgi:2-dehydropantoate 2-reductase